MNIDLGTCKISIPDNAPLVPVQLVCRGQRDEMEALSVKMLKGPAAQAQAYSRAFSLSIEETPEGMSERDALEAWTRNLIAAYRGSDPEVIERPVEQGVSRIVGFRWRGPNAVPVRSRALVHVADIVVRTAVLCWLDAPKVNPHALAQFNAIVESMEPKTPRIVP